MSPEGIPRYSRSSQQRGLGRAAIANSSAPENAGYDFISLLGLSQRLKVELLPLTWQTALGALNPGGRTEIYELYMAPEISFAFKPFNQESLSDPYNEVVSELLVLTHEAVREHPYIVKLEGLCWDVLDDGQVQPVLVMQKSHYGDLHDFMKSKQGRELSLDERRRLCVDIGIAIRDMHANNIIHGDIKPENILVFQEESSRFVVKVADFGFSTRFRGDNDAIGMPRSPIWSAPEWHDGWHRPKDAKKMDIFSFGMVCLWMLFGVNRPPDSIGQDNTFIGFDEKHDWAQTNLERRRNNKLMSWALSVASEAAALDKSNLVKFFKGTLPVDRQRRETDIDKLLRLLDRDCNLPEVLCFATEATPAEEDFQLPSLFHPLHHTDFRVPAFVVSKLAEISASVQMFHRISPRKAALQLAACYASGFGVGQDEGRAHEILSQHAIDPEEMDSLIQSIRKGPDNTMSPRDLFRDLNRRGLAHAMNPAEHYLEKGVLERAATVAESDISAMEELLGPCHPTYLDKKIELLRMRMGQGRWPEAEGLEAQIMDATSKTYGTEHTFTLASMASLASIFRDQGRWEAAERLEVQVLTSRKTKLGLDHPSTLTSTNNLAVTYRYQGRWEEAEELGIQVIEISETKLGLDHPDTLISKSNLAMIYRDQGRLEEAEKQEVQILEMSKRKLGEDHPSTLTTLNNLGLTRLDQGQLKAAEKLFVQAFEGRKTKLGADHPATLVSMNNLALTYSAQGRKTEAEKFQRQMIKSEKMKLGADHPRTLDSIDSLASILWSQGRRMEAEELLVEVMEGRKTKLRADHPSILSSMASLAHAWKSQGRNEDALVLMSECVSLRSQTLGPDHPDTRGSSAALDAWQADS